MSKLTKNQKTAEEKVDFGKQYRLLEACRLVKETNYAKFDASVDLAVRLGVDPRKANQMVRGVVTLPHGTGKVTRVLVLCTPDKENEAREAVWTNSLRKSKAAGLMSMSSSVLPPSWVRSVPWAVSSVPAD